MCLPWIRPDNSGNLPHFKVNSVTILIQSATSHLPGNLSYSRVLSLEGHYSSYHNEWFSISAFLLAFGVITIFHFSHSNGSIVISYWMVLICISLVADGVEYIFMCLPFHVLFGKIFVHIFSPFYNWIVWLFICLLMSFEFFYIFYILVLCWICGFQTFSPTLYLVFSSS